MSESERPWALSDVVNVVTSDHAPDDVAFLIPPRRRDRLGEPAESVAEWVERCVRIEGVRGGDE